MGWRGLNLLHEGSSKTLLNGAFLHTRVASRVLGSWSWVAHALATWQIAADESNSLSQPRVTCTASILSVSSFRDPNEMARFSPQAPARRSPLVTHL